MIDRIILQSSPILEGMQVHGAWVCREHRRNLREEEKVGKRFDKGRGGNRALRYNIRLMSTNHTMIKIGGRKRRAFTALRIHTKLAKQLSKFAALMPGAHLDLMQRATRLCVHLRTGHIHAIHESSSLDQA